MTPASHAGAARAWASMAGAILPKRRSVGQAPSTRWAMLVVSPRPLLAGREPDDMGIGLTFAGRLLAWQGGPHQAGLRSTDRFLVGRRDGPRAGLRAISLHEARGRRLRSGAGLPPRVIPGGDGKFRNPDQDPSQSFWQNVVWRMR